METKSSSNPVTFTILCDGRQINNNVHSLSITLEKDGADVAIITWKALSDEEQNPFARTDDFPLNSQIEITLGYGNVETSVFEGIVVEDKAFVNGSSEMLFKSTCEFIETAINVETRESQEEEPLELTLGENIEEAELYIDRADRNVLKGSIKLQGMSKVKSTTPVVLKGMETHFPTAENEVSINSVRHQLEEGDWKTTLIVGPD